MSKQLVWFITGASTGLGLALTRRILERGDLVVATARNINRFEPLLSHPDTDLTRIHILELDITSPFSIVQDTVKNAVNRWGRIEVLVNNAGTGGGVGPSEELGLELMMRVMKTNYAGTVNVTNAVLPYMRERREGTVLIIGSRSAYRNEFLLLMPRPKLPYTVRQDQTLFHPWTLTLPATYGETLSAEVAEFNIRVSVVVPGAFDTGLALPIVGTPIPDYNRAREALRKRIEDRENMPVKGDPEKAMNAVMDAIRGEGKAAGKGKLPLWLFLGGDCLGDVNSRVDKLKQVAKEWADVGTGLGKDDAL